MFEDLYEELEEIIARLKELAEFVYEADVIDVSKIYDWTRECSESENKRCRIIWLLSLRSKRSNRMPVKYGFGSGFV